MYLAGKRLDWTKRHICRWVMCTLHMRSQPCHCFYRCSTCTSFRAKLCIRLTRATDIHHDVNSRYLMETSSCNSSLRDSATGLKVLHQHLLYPDELHSLFFSNQVRFLGPRPGFESVIYIQNQTTLQLLQRVRGMNHSEEKVKEAVPHSIPKWTRLRVYSHASGSLRPCFGRAALWAKWLKTTTYFCFLPFGFYTHNCSGCVLGSGALPHPVQTQVEHQIC